MPLEEMTETDEFPNHLTILPTEILLYIFSFLPAKQLTKGREVCSRWKQIIDGLARSDTMWYFFCKKDFSNVYTTAWRKSHLGLIWYNIYRSLSLWPKLATAREIRDEFASASNISEEIQDFTVLRDGMIGVHTKSKIVYYDIDTLKPSERGPIAGDYLRYTENDDIIVVMSFHLHLFVIRKHFSTPGQESNVTFDKTKMFLLVNRELFFVNLNDEIYVCELNDRELRASLINRLEDGVMSLGYNNDQLNVLSVNRTIYTVRGMNLMPACTLGPNTNLLHKLREYNLLEQLDWRIYFQWMYVLNHTIPQGPLRDIVTIRSYGDVFFVGSNWGVLRIYYAPYCAGEFDIFHSEPLKQFNFMERYDCPVLSMCPILQVDVSEAEDGHTVFVAMPKKIAVLKFIHNFKRTASVAMLPFNDIQKMKILKIQETQ